MNWGFLRFEINPDRQAPARSLNHQLKYKMAGTDKSIST
jgi:hypothetical protein